MGPIFIRASYGTSHGQNNISMVVTGRWRQDESRIKIKPNEYKWRLLHLEGGINHMWTNAVCSLSLSLSLCRFFASRPLFLSLFRCFSFSDSLHLIKLATKCPSVLIIRPERWGAEQRYLLCVGVRNVSRRPAISLMQVWRLCDAFPLCFCACVVGWRLKNTHAQINLSNHQRLLERVVVLFVLVGCCEWSVLFKIVQTAVSTRLASTVRCVLTLSCVSVCVSAQVRSKSNNCSSFHGFNWPHKPY